MLAQELNFEFVSIGHFSRDYALKHFSMDINQFQDYCQKNSQTDKFIDEYFVKYCAEKTNLVIDYRLAYPFIKDC